MGERYELIPPGRTKRLFAWVSPSRKWAIIGLFMPWMFHVGLEVWAHGIALNIGPLCIGWAQVERAA